MPGWGIFADLIPPEILAERRARVLRKYVTIGLIALLVLLLAVFAFAFFKKSAAQHDLDTAQAQTVQLQQEERKYADVITIQGTVTQVQSQVASLLKTDIDFPSVLSSLQKALPPNVKLTQLTVGVSTPSAQPGPQVGTGSTGGQLDTGTNAHIGTVTLSGSAAKSTDVSAYVDRLKTLKGIVEPFPTSNVSAGNGVTFSIQCTLTDELFTHRFDVK